VWVWMCVSVRARALARGSVAPVQTPEPRPRSVLVQGLHVHVPLSLIRLRTNDLTVCVCVRMRARVWASECERKSVHVFTALSQHTILGHQQRRPQHIDAAQSHALARQPQQVLRLRVAVEDAVFRAFLVIDDKLHRHPRAAWPLGICAQQRSAAVERRRPVGGSPRHQVDTEHASRTAGAHNAPGGVRP